MSATTYDSTEVSDDGVIKSLVPARIDRMSWSRFHTRLVIALGVAWVLDGLEITIAGNVTNIISKPERARLSAPGRSPSPSAPSTCSARWPARCSSAGCPTSGAGGTCS